MKRAISPVIAIVVLMLMTVSAAGMAYLTITTYQDQAQSSSEGAIERLATVGQSQIKVESIGDGKLYLRSIGENCESLIVQVGNEPAQVLGDCQDTMDVFDITSECEGGTQTVKIISGGQTITQQVECSELIGQIIDDEAPLISNFYLISYSDPCTGIIRCQDYWHDYGNILSFNATVSDASTGGSGIDLCQFRNGSDPSWYTFSAKDGSFDSSTEDIEFLNAEAEGPTGEYNITIRCNDTLGNNRTVIAIDDSCPQGASYTYSTIDSLPC